MWLNSSMPHRTEPNDGASNLLQNPLVASVLRENVRVADGRAMIGLWEGWPFLLSELPAFGPVLAITRNCYAVLGTIAEYPQVVRCLAAIVAGPSTVRSSLISPLGRAERQSSSRA